MTDYLNFYQSQGDLDTIEHSLVKLNPKQMDFDGVIKFCAKHNLYDGLIYVFTSGIQDYISPFNFLKDHIISKCGIDSQSTTPLETLSNQFESKRDEDIAVCSEKLISYAVSVLNDETGNTKDYGTEGQDFSLTRVQIFEFLFNEKFNTTLKH